MTRRRECIARSILLWCARFSRLQALLLAPPLPPLLLLPNPSATAIHLTSATTRNRCIRCWSLAAPKHASDTPLKQQCSQLLSCSFPLPSLTPSSFFSCSSSPYSPPAAYLFHPLTKSKRKIWFQFSKLPTPTQLQPAAPLPPHPCPTPSACPISSNSTPKSSSKPLCCVQTQSRTQSKHRLCDVSLQRSQTWAFRRCPRTYRKAKPTSAGLCYTENHSNFTTVFPL